jgi:GT2 family glycosyltransferase
MNPQPAAAPPAGLGPVPAASWIVMPVIDCLDYTRNALADLRGQRGLPAPPRILVVDNGSERETRRMLEELQVTSGRQVLCWWHHPPLGGAPGGTVNASWNRALDFVWACGGEHALVVNNDVRLHLNTLTCLQRAMAASGALFVSAVGVTEDDFAKAQHPERGAGVYDPHAWSSAFHDGPLPSLGGPDFSCFLISRKLHRDLGVRFDEQFTYFGDNDYHRRLQLQGLGDSIFSINVPYLHYGSRTIARSDAARAAHHAVFEAHRTRYVEKWGGLPQEETKKVPYAWTCSGCIHPDDSPCRCGCHRGITDPQELARSRR